MTSEEDSIEEILEDAEAVFRFETGSRPQDRAHRYLEEHKVNRGYNDTALLCVVNDLIARAQGLSGDERKMQADGGMARALMVKCAGELLEAAEAIR